MDQDNARLGELQQKHDEIHAKDSQKAVRSGFLQWEFEPQPYKGKIHKNPMKYRWSHELQGFFLTP